MKYNFKKIVAMILCMVMLISNTVPYFAEDNFDESVVTVSEEISKDEPENDTSVSQNTESTDESDVEQSDESTATNSSEDSNEPTMEQTTESETSVEDEETDATTMSLTDESLNLSEATSINIVEEENIATISNADSSDSGENGDNIEDTEIAENSVNTKANDATANVVNTINIATLSEVKTHELSIDSIATVSEIKIATISDATSDETINSDEDLPTGFLKIDYEAPIVEPLFRNGLFGVAPNSYDSRTETNPANPDMSIIPPMRSQGSYETCWAFSTIGMMEINARKKGLVDNEDDSNLSEAALAYFTYDGMKQALDSTQYDYSESIDKPGQEGYDKTFLNTTSYNFATFRGNQMIGTLALSSYLGATKENDDTRYENIGTIINNFQTDGRGLPGRYAFNSNSFVIKDVKFINKNNRDLIKQAIMDYGSVGFSYGASSNYKVVDGEYYLYQSSGSANHSIIIVGWNDNVPVSNFLTEPSGGPGAWLCRNSYGSSHANGGYFWLSYFDNTIDNNMYAVEVVKADTYDYNYHYDTNGDTATLTYNISVSESNPLRFANIFKVSSDHNQLLKAVSIGIGSTNTTFNIKVYTKDTQMSFPADGTLAATVNGVTKDTAGIYTVELSNEVVLAKDTYYSIIVEGTAGTFESVSEPANKFAMYISSAQASIPRDINNSIQFRNAAEQSQSFYGGGTITTSANWRDINTGTYPLQTIDGVLCGRNLRIKGLTIENDTIINFDGNGADNTMSSQSVPKGIETNIKPNEFTKQGYTFDGWRVVGTDAPYGDGAPITITDEISLKAQWVPVTYTINYNANGGTATETSFDKTYEVEYTGTFATANKLGYMFGGWYVDNTTFSTPFTSTTDIYNNTATSFEIYAKWNPVTYTLQLNALGGTGTTPLPTEYVYGNALSLPMDYTKDGAAIVGWYKEYDPATGTYTGTRYTSIPAQASSDILPTDVTTPIILYAKYAMRHYITYIAGGGSGSMGVQTIYEGDEVVLNSNSFYRNGYSFARWRASNGAIYNNHQNIGLITSDLILTAEWNKEKSGGNGGGGGGGGGGGIPVTPKTQTDKTTVLSVSFNDIALSYANSTNSAWQADALGKWHLNTINAFGQTEEVKNSWVCLDSEITIDGQVSIVKDFYFFDSTGEMLTGWLTDGSSKKYYLEQNNGADIGKMARGWKAIGTNYYYFNQDGTLFTSGVTPDGYTVDANGVWLK